MKLDAEERQDLQDTIEGIVEITLTTLETMLKDERFIKIFSELSKQFFASKQEKKVSLPKTNHSKVYKNEKT